MATSFAPEPIRKQVVEAFSDAEAPAYAQFGTTDAEGNSQIRTVHFHYLSELDVLAFNAHVRSPKWAHLKANPKASGCYFDTKRLIQFRFEAEACCFADGGGHDPLLDSMWAKIRPDVRAAYWEDQSSSSFDVDRRCSTLGVIVLQPTLWDICTIAMEDYRKGRRVLYRNRKGVWSEERVSLLHGEAPPSR
ncbi:MAG TPA: pyridoxamine 5'-phosphate oxidase family protein [Bdellovibrionota bacterium]|nr:pyridoxamine 5'-phosphate oxidase family protein [Bdellovibrionota bacterium]